MRKTITIRLTKAQGIWLDRTAKATGRKRGEIVREQLEKARAAPGARPFMRLAGSVSGPASLSSRKGFAKS